MITKTTGPMMAGKSLALIDAYLSDNGSKVCVKPSGFDRDGASVVSRGCKITIPCLLIGSGIGHSFGGVDTLYVDEAQGFTLAVLTYLSRMAKSVRFYGLDVWADGTTTSLGQFMAEEEEQLTAICKCGKPATMTKHISGDDPITAVYEAVCSECWNEDMEEACLVEAVLSL